MKKFELLAATASMLLVGTPAMAQTGTTTQAQDAAPTNGPGQESAHPARRHDAETATSS